MGPLDPERRRVREGQSILGVLVAPADRALPLLQTDRGIQEDLLHLLALRYLSHLAVLYLQGTQRALEVLVSLNFQGIQCLLLSRCGAQGDQEGRRYLFLQRNLCRQLLL